MVWTVLVVTEPVQANTTMTLQRSSAWPQHPPISGLHFVPSSQSGSPAPSLSPPHVARRPMIELCIPSSLDPTLAPPGCHVISLFTQYTPYTLAAGKVWDEQERNAHADRGKEG